MDVQHQSEHTKLRSHHRKFLAYFIHIDFYDKK